MQSTETSRPRRRGARLALFAALAALGCPGGSGGGCGSSCGGAFKTKNPDGTPIKFTGSRLDNAAQVRITSSGLGFLDAAHLNDVIASLNGDSSLSQDFVAPDGTNTLSFWVRVVCPGSVARGWATATLTDNTAQTTLTILPPTCTNTGAFAQVRAALTAKHGYTLKLSNHDSNDAAGATYTYYDDVAISGPANPIINGGFETGTLAGWTGTGVVEASSNPHSGSYSAQVGSTSPGVTLPCIDAGELFNLCSIGVTKIHLLAGDENFNGTCDAADKTPLHVEFKSVSWGLDPAHNVLKAHLLLHLKTGDIYLRTVEEHSFICGGTSAIQARVAFDDNLPGLPQPFTQADMNIAFSTTPDGRLEFNFDDSSLASLVANFQPAALVFDGKIGDDPAPAATGSYNGNGCDSGTGTYTVAKSATELSCSAVFNDLNAGCDFTQPTNQGALCSILAYVRGYLFDYIKSSFKNQIVKMLRQQLDNLRCQRSVDSQNNAHACDAAHACPVDDDGNQLSCDTSRGVCYPATQGNAGYNCEPITLAVQGELDVSGLTDKVGFPPDTRLKIFAGLGSKGANGGGRIDANGIQLAAEAGTAPPGPNCATDADCVSGATCVSNICSSQVALCVPPALPPAAIAVPPMDFDSSSNKPATVTGYEVGFSLASAMLNRGFYDAYNAGLLCLAITNKTSAFISSGLFKTFLPSLGLLTGGHDVPMMILLRPTLPPYVRVGLNSTKKDSAGNDIPDDPLLTVSFNQLHLDFYALVDERQVRLFTLQADLKLPLNLRTFPDHPDMLQPVLGGLDTLLTDVSALSPDGSPYSPAVDMLSEDPGVVKDILAAAVQLAQPLLAGAIKPMQLPTMLGLKLGVAGIAGAVATTDTVNDGYNHLAVWANLNACGTVACERYNVKTQVQVVDRVVPDTLREIRAGARPGIELQLSALQARAGTHAEYSYRVDRGLWSPWLSNPRLYVQNALFLVQGHHLVEVIAREAGDDQTMDPDPWAVDFFVSYEPPQVSLSQRQDGAIVTVAHSAASKDAALAFSYRIDGDQVWTQPGGARIFAQDELGGRGLSVSVSDEAGRSAQAHFGEEEGTQLARAGMTGGCTTSGAPALAVLALLGAALRMSRQRKGWISRG